MTPHDDIQSLILSYLEGRLSPEQTEHLLKQVNEHEEVRQTLFEMKNLYDLCQTDTLTQKQIETGLERIVTGQPHIQITEDKQRPVSPLQKFRRITLRYAAVALLGLAAGGLLNRYVWSHRAPQYNEITAEAKNHSSITLSDGTKVSLNASTRLRYPTSFNGSTREVYLDGEAFFEVAHDTGKPFIVRTEHQSIRVLGTAFNVMAYNGDAFSTVTLLSGSVQLDLFGLQGQTLHTMQMKPYEQTRFDIENGKLSVTLLPDDDRHRCWTDGVFRFRNEELRMIVSRLEKYYGVTITVGSDSLAHTLYTGAFPLDQKIEDVLQTLNYEQRFSIGHDGKNFTLNLKRP